MNGEARFTTTLFLLIGGFAIWAAHFLFIYGYAGLLCAHPEWARMQILSFGVVSFGVAAATIAALFGLAILAAFSWQGGRRTTSSGGDARFLAMISTGGAGLAAIAIVWEGVFSILTVPACV